MRNRLATSCVWLMLGLGPTACTEPYSNPMEAPRLERKAALTVQAAAPLIDQDVCVNTTCDRASPATTPATFTERTCELGAVEAVPILSVSMLTTNCGPLGACTETPGGSLAMDTAIAPDGSMWLVRPVATTAGDDQSAGVLVEHYVGQSTPRLSLLAEEHSKRGDLVRHAVRVVTDERSHAFVSVGTLAFREGDSRPTAWRVLFELDESEQPVSDPMQLSTSKHPWPSEPSAASVHWAGERRVAVGPGGYGESAVAVVDIELRQAPWVQTRVGLNRPFAPRPEHAEPRWVYYDPYSVPPPFSMVADAMGQVSLLTHARYDDAERLQRAEIEQYDANGELAWSRSLPAPFGHDLWTTLRTDRAGGLIQSGFRRREDLGIELWVHKLGPDGQSEWLTRIELGEGYYLFAPADTSVSEDGTIYVAGVRYEVQETLPEGGTAAVDPYGSAVFQLSADGSECRAMVVQDGYFDKVIASANGELHGLGYDSLVRVR